MYSQFLPTPKFNKLFISCQSVWNFSSLGNKCSWIYFPCSYEPDEFSTLDLYLWNSNLKIKLLKSMSDSFNFTNLWQYFVKIFSSFVDKVFYASQISIWITSSFLHFMACLLTLIKVKFIKLQYIWVKGYFTSQTYSKVTNMLSLFLIIFSLYIWIDGNLGLNFFRWTILFSNVIYWMLPFAKDSRPPHLFTMTSMVHLQPWFPNLFHVMKKKLHHLSAGDGGW